MSQRFNPSPQRKQLYYLLKQLSGCVDDRDELGTIVSYTVLEGLYGFTAKSHAKEEIQFEQVKQVYDQLNFTIDKLVERLKTTGPENAGYDILCDKMKAIDPRLKVDVESQIIDERPELLARIIETLPQRGYQDRIRRRGLQLLEIVERRGELKGNRDTLIGDYNDLSRCLTGGTS